MYMLYMNFYMYFDAINAESQLPGRGPTDVDDAPAVLHIINKKPDKMMMV